MNGRGYRGCGSRSTPTTSKPARPYPTPAPPAQQNKSSSLGFELLRCRCKSLSGTVPVTILPNAVRSLSGIWSGSMVSSYVKAFEEKAGRLSRIGHVRPIGNGERARFSGLAAAPLSQVGAVFDLRLVGRRPTRITTRPLGNIGDVMRRGLVPDTCYQYS